MIELVLELFGVAIAAPAATHKQHPKPLPTPRKVEVFKDSNPLNILTAVEADASSTNKGIDQREIRSKESYGGRERDFF